MDKNKGGRPRHGDQVKTAPLSMRIDPNLRAMLEQCAEENKRSLTQEVEARLSMSFGQRELMLLDEDVHEMLLVAIRENGTDLGTELNSRLSRSFTAGLVALPAPVAEQLLAAAQQRGWSPDEEAADRLRHSFIEESFFGSAETPRLLRAIGSAIDRIEGETGAKWTEDRQTWFAVREAASIIITSNAPAKVAPLFEPKERAIEEEKDEIRAQFASLIEKYQTHYRDLDPKHLDRDHLLDELKVMREMTELQLAFAEADEKLAELAQPRVERNTEARKRAWDATERALAEVRVTDHQRNLPRRDEWELITYRRKANGDVSQI